MSSFKRICVLSVHDEKFSSEEVLFNPDLFPKLQVGDVFKLYLQDKENREKTAKNKLIVKINQIPATKVKSFQISVVSWLAQLFDFTARSEMVVKQIVGESLSANSIEFAEITFKDQFVERSDMWRLKLSLIDTPVFVGKNVSHSCVKAQVRELVGHGGKNISSGLISDKTKFIFRSRSSRIVICFQMSREMWDFNTSGDLHWEIAANKLLREIWERWNSLGTNHTITIIFFSRTYYNVQAEEHSSTDGSPFQFDTDGRRFRDFYKIVFEDTKFDWDSLVVQLKKEFKKYPQLVHWQATNSESTNSLGQNSAAAQGNFLEAINLALGIFEKDYVDRDLSRTGKLIIAISAGCGIFEVHKPLTQLTKQKMIENGIGCDLICVSMPPLHSVPLFKFKQTADKEVRSNSSFDLPHWIHTSFYNASLLQYQNTVRYNSATKHKKDQQIFVPRCSMNQQNTTFQQGMAVARSEKASIILPLQLKQPPAPPLQSQSLKKSQSSTTLNRIGSGLQSVYLPPTGNSYSYQYQSFDESVFSYTDSISGFGVSPNANRMSLSSTKFQSTTQGQNQEEASSWGSQSSMKDLQNLTSTPSTNPPQSGVTHANNTTPLSAYSRRSLTPARNHQAPSMKNPFESDSILGVHAQNVSSSLFPGSDKRTSGRSRWSHLFSGSGGVAYNNSFPFLPNWKSLSEPASLPITNNYFPDPNELNIHFVEYVYNLNLDDENQTKFQDVFNELLSQRLNQGYQMILFEADNYHYRNTGQDLVDSKKVCSYLSLGHNYHKLTYDKASQNIEVKRYSRKDQVNKTNTRKTIPYTFFVAPYVHDASKRDLFVPVTIDLTIKQSSSHFPWNYLDQLVCGYYTDLIDSIRYNRIRFVLTHSAQSSMMTTSMNAFPTGGNTVNPALRRNIPVSNLNQPVPPQPNNAASNRSTSLSNDVYSMQVPSVEEKTNAFLKFKSLLLTGKISKNTQASTGESMDITVIGYQNTKNESPFLAHNSSGLLDPSNLLQIRLAMGNKTTGVSVQDRKYRLKAYKQCFVSSEAVDWLMKNVKSPNNTRNDALKICQQLFEAGYIEHVADKTEFNDGEFFYRFKTTDEQLLSKATNQNDGLPPPTIYRKLDKVIKIDMDSSKTERPEWVLLRYDSTFCPGVTYHLEINWVTATGPVIDDYLNTLSRKAKMCGFALVPIPLDQNSHSFVSQGLDICLKPDFWQTGIFEQLIPRFDFIAEIDDKVELSTPISLQSVNCFVHKTGAAFIKKVNTTLLKWEFSSLPSARIHFAMCFSIFKEFKQLCEQGLDSIVNPESSNVVDPSNVMSPRTNPQQPIPPKESQSSDQISKSQQQDAQSPTTQPNQASINQQELVVAPVNPNICIYYLVLRN